MPGDSQTNSNVPSFKQEVSKPILLDTLELDKEYSIREVDGEWSGELDSIAWTLLREIMSSLAELAQRVCNIPPDALEIKAYLRSKGERSKVGFHLYLRHDTLLGDDAQAMRSAAVLILINKISGNNDAVNMNLGFDGEMINEHQQTISDLATTFLTKHGEKVVSPAIKVAIANNSTPVMLSGKLGAKPRQSLASEPWTVHCCFDGAVLQSRECFLLDMSSRGKKFSVKFRPERHLNEIYERLWDGNVYAVELRERHMANGAIEIEIENIADVPPNSSREALELISPLPVKSSADREVSRRTSAPGKHPQSRLESAFNARYAK